MPNAGEGANAPLRFIEIGNALERVPFHKATMYRKIRRGEFPRTVKLGRRKAALIESEFEEYLRALAAGRLAEWMVSYAARQERQAAA